MNKRRIQFLVFLVDFLILQATLFLVLSLRFERAELIYEWERHYPLFTILAVIWLLSFYVADLYNFINPFNYRRFFICMAVNTGLAISFFYLFVEEAVISPKTNLALVVLIFVVFFLLWRGFFSLLMDKMGIKRPVVFIGMDSHSLELAEEIVKSPRLGYSISAFVIGETEETEVEIPEWVKNSRILLLRNMEELSEHLESDGTHSIVVSENWYRDIYQNLYNFIPRGIRVYQLSSFWELIDETIPVYATDETWFLQNMTRGPYTVYHPFKRFFDVVFTIVLFPPILLLSLCTAVMVKVSSRGPVLFLQNRVGLDNQVFTLYKFRSMKVDAEKYGAVWATENDPRLTPVGNFIRKVRLDELPQIINVLRGEMSFVGPRPERPEFVGQLAEQIPHYNLRHLVKPGLTGWAQVKYRYGSSVEDSAVKLMYDLYYVKNISPILDVKIVLKTILTVLTKGGR